MSSKPHPVSETSPSHTRLGPGREFDRIRRIVAELGNRAVGLGDDCAVLAAEGDQVCLSTDVSVEGVHFRREWLTLEEIGWRSAAAALSDLAAAAALPIGLLAALVIPEDLDPEAAEQLMVGVGGAAAMSGASVLGGDLSSGGLLSLTITVVGRTEHHLGRSGARVGDRLWVSGTLGGARSALEQWRTGEGTDPDHDARHAFAKPEPRIAEGRWLAHRGAHALIDLSDGLAGDVRHLAAASGVGCVVNLDALPLHISTGAGATLTGQAAAVFAAIGGEDYELLAAMPESFTPEAREFAVDFGTPLTNIGVVLDGPVQFLLDGEDVDLQGYSHFQ